MKNRLLFLTAILCVSLTACGTSSSEEDVAISEESEANTAVDSNSEEEEEPADADDEEDISEQESEDGYTRYSAGNYKIGTDMPAGEYILFENGYGGYFEVTSDSSGSLDSIIVNDAFESNSIITVSDGQYLEMTDCYAIPFDENPPVDVDGPGMFKVGVHIEAGEYKATVLEDAYTGYAYIEVSSDSSHELESIITNDNFEGSKYITLSDGQYVCASYCSLAFVESIAGEDEEAEGEDIESTDITISDLSELLRSDISYVQELYPDADIQLYQEGDGWFYIMEYSYYGEIIPLQIYVDSDNIICGVIGKYTGFDDIDSAISHTKSVEESIIDELGDPSYRTAESIAAAYMAGEYYSVEWTTSDTYAENSLYFTDEDGNEIYSYYSGVLTMEVVDMINDNG